MRRIFLVGKYEQKEKNIIALYLVLYWERKNSFSFVVREGKG